MNIENLEFLKNQVTYSGFGDIPEKALVENIIAGKKEFKIEYRKEFFNGKTVDAELNFRKSNTQDRYFFNSYDLSIEKEDGKMLKQRFKVELGNTFTLREAFNMMEERYPSKGEKWYYIDFTDKDRHGNGKIKNFGQKYGFDLDKLLQEYPIKALLNDANKTALESSLKKGNRQSTLFVDAEGKDVPRYIEVDVRYKKLKVYDENQQLLVMSQKGSLEDNLEAGKKKEETQTRGEQREKLASEQQEQNRGRRRRAQGV